MKKLNSVLAPLALVSAIALAGGCRNFVLPLKGGNTTTTLGGANAPTTVQAHAPQDPQTPTRTVLDKKTTTEYATPPAVPQPAPVPVRAAPVTNSIAVPVSIPAPAPVASVPAVPQVYRQTVEEHSSTETGVSQKDTARELGARLAAMRGAMWVGIALLIIGPIAGWYFGWLIPGCIAGGTGLLLIILADVIPGNEVWFGLFALLAIPAVLYVWYHGHAEGSKTGVAGVLETLGTKLHLITSPPAQAPSASAEAKPAAPTS